MAFNVRQYLGLTTGSQGGKSELFLIEKLLEHYSPGHDSDSILDNPKFQFDPENPSEVALEGGDVCFSETITLESDLSGNVPVKATAFTYTFPVCF